MKAKERGRARSLLRREVAPLPVQYRLGTAETPTACGRRHRVRVRDMESCMPGGGIHTHTVLLIMIQTMFRLAPPPSPFTLQGHLLQQQLAFHPESSSRCGPTCTRARVELTVTLMPSSAHIGQYCSVVSEGRGLGSALPPLRLQPAEDSFCDK